MNFKLDKNERLHSKKLIKELFDKGSSFFLYPFKVLILEVDSAVSETNQVLFSVSKKKVKKAVKRNLLKRRIKESFRLNKHTLYNDKESSKLIALIYVSSDIMEYADIEKKLSKALKAIQDYPNTTKIKA